MKGTRNVGLAAISAKVGLGSKKTPPRRDASLIPAGGGGSGAFSGDISDRLYSPACRAGSAIMKELMRIAVLLALLASCACKPAEQARQKAIIGAVLIDG